MAKGSVEELRSELIKALCGKAIQSEFAGVSHKKSTFNVLSLIRKVAGNAW